MISRISKIKLLFLITIITILTLTFASPIFANKKNNADPVAVATSYFKALGEKNMKTIFSLLDENVRFVTPMDTVEGKDKAQTFFNLFKNLETKEFVISKIIGDSQYAVAFGNFRHIVKTTGKPFESDWAAVFEVTPQGKIKLYQFYEDSAAFEAALTP